MEAVHDTPVLPSIDHKAQSHIDLRHILLQIEHFIVKNRV